MSLTRGSARVAVAASLGVDEVDRGAPLTEVAGGLFSERCVLGPQARDLCACCVQARAERFSGATLGGRDGR
jgi:hypothetical protein